MALTTTSLTAAISASKVYRIGLVSTVGFAVNQPVMIDGEITFCANVNALGNYIDVRLRGADGTAAAAHDVNATVTTGLVQDFPLITAGAANIQPPTDDQVATIGSDQTVVLPNENVAYYITKPSICNITLAAPTAPQIGVEATFVASTAFAHVITYAPGFIGGASTVATMSGKVGASLQAIVGVGGILAAIEPNDNVTFTL